MLARIALRMAVVEALKGRTLVEDNVLDSQIGVIATDAEGNVTSGQSAPFIAVYTDTGETAAEGLRGLLGSAQCQLVIETGVTGTMVERSEDREETVAGIPATDAGFELLLDLLARQVIDALLSAGNPWSDLFQALVVRVGKVVRQRVGHHQVGTRIAAHEIRISLDLVEEPERGVALDSDGAFGMWLALLSNDVGLMGRVRDYLIALQLDQEDGWELVRQRLGLSIAELLALGLGPADGVDKVTIGREGGTSVELAP